jgi:hypothetical protein
MLEGKMALGTVTQGMLFGTAVLMAVPALMVALSVLLPAAVARWTNIGAGIFYAGIMLLILIGGAWAFYMFFAAVEVAVTLAIVWLAWRWPRESAS